jgi:hypothetical protein
MEGAPLRNEDSEARPSLRAKRWRGEALRRRPPLLGWALRRLCLRRLCPARRIPNEATNRRKDRRRQVSTSPKASSTEGRAGGSAGGAGHRLPLAASDGGEAAVARPNAKAKPPSVRLRSTSRKALTSSGTPSRRRRGAAGAALRPAPLPRAGLPPGRGLSCRPSLRRGPFAQAENRT